MTMLKLYLNYPTSTQKKHAPDSICNFRLQSLKNEIYEGRLKLLLFDVFIRFIKSVKYIKGMNQLESDSI